MKKLFSVLIIPFALVAMMSAAKAAPIELILNGGFETGDLTGWNASPNVFVLPNHVGVIPDEGIFMAVMPIGGVFDAFLDQIFDSDEDVTSATLSFSFNIQALDVSGNPFNGQDFDFGEDSLTISLGGSSTVVLLNDVFDGSFGGGGFNPGDSTTSGWQTLSTPVDVALLNSGPLTIAFNVENHPFFLPGGGGDPGQFFSAYIDNVSVRAETVPEPSTLALVGLGLISLVGLRLNT